MQVTVGKAWWSPFLFLFHLKPTVYDLSCHFTWKSTSETLKSQKKGRSLREARQRNTEARTEAVGAEAAHLQGSLPPLSNDTSSGPDLGLQGGMH